VGIKGRYDRSRWRAGRAGVARGLTVLAAFALIGALVAPAAAQTEPSSSPDAGATTTTTSPEPSPPSPAGPDEPTSPTPSTTLPPSGTPDDPGSPDTPTTTTPTTPDDGADPADPSGDPPTAPAPPEPGDEIAGHYVVQLDPGTDAHAAAVEEQSRGNPVDEVFDTAIDGFAAELEPSDVARLAADPDVVSVEPDLVVGVSASEPAASWGLDRIDQHALPLNGTYRYDSTASGVDVYIVDTGVRADHSDFGGRVVAGHDVVGGVAPPASDCHGHGTHVAGTTAGTTYGIAKTATIVPVRVLNCYGSGTMSGVVAGLDWVVERHQAGQPAVINMSLGGGASSALDAAVARATTDGIVVVVAAGNSNADACDASPARAPSAITVGATTSTDARAGYSNIGTCLDLFAPGSIIKSASKSSTTATTTMSGTSMASPHVAGVAAIAFARAPGASPAAVTEAVLDLATPGVVTSAGGGSPNLLLYGDFGPAPANDDLTDATPIGGTIGASSEQTVGASAEPGEPAHAGAPAMASVWFAWRAPTTGFLTLDTVGSDFDTRLAAYQGAAGMTSLTAIAANDNGASTESLSQLRMGVRGGVDYRIAIDGSAGATGAAQLRWSFIAAPAARPDALVRRAGDPRFVGAGVYRLLAKGQAVVQRTRRGTRTKTIVRIENDGALTDSLRIRGSSGRSGIAVRYYLGRRNVTTQVVRGTLQLTGLASGASRQLLVVATVARAARPRTRRDVHVIARSMTTNAADTARAIVIAT
jgi:subtilisin family serine protease